MKSRSRTEAKEEIRVLSTRGSQGAKDRTELVHVSPRGSDDVHSADLDSRPKGVIGTETRTNRKPQGSKTGRAKGASKRETERRRKEKEGNDRLRKSLRPSQGGALISH